MPTCLVLNEKDNVAVAVEPVKPGDRVELSSGGTLKAMDEIPFAHKIAITPIPKGNKVLKYGEIIGQATRDIIVGQHIHVHNIRSLRVGKK